MILLIIMNPPSVDKPDYHEIACQQILAQDQSVFSIQWVIIPGKAAQKMTSNRLLEIYLQYVKLLTLHIVCPAMTENGLEFSLCNSSIALIKFNMPVHQAVTNGSCTTIHICGGALVQPGECDRGQMDFMVEQICEDTCVTLQLSDFCPLLLGSNRPAPWRKWFYRLTQAYIHKVVTVRFLAMVYRQLAGDRPHTRVVKVALRKGEET